MQAFHQAMLDEPVFMKIPQGWYVNEPGDLAQHDDPRYNNPSHSLSLKHNLHGCKKQLRIGLNI